MDYLERHHLAMALPKPGFEQSIRDLVGGWESYAMAHRDRYGSVIGEDYILGDAWRDVGLALHRLLDGETGRFDCGTLDQLLGAIAETHGMTLDENLGGDGRLPLSAQEASK